MVATKLDGNSIAKAIRERLGAEIAEKQQKNPRYRPSLRIIQGMAAHAQDSKAGDMFSPCPLAPYLSFCNNSY
jgi:hypothetical protein